jgi:hypothetical protein
MLNGLRQQGYYWVMQDGRLHICRYVHWKGGGFLFAGNAKPYPDSFFSHIGAAPIPQPSPNQLIPVSG